MALGSLALAGFTDVRLDLCHVGVVRAILQADAAAMRAEQEIFGLLRAKDLPALREATASYSPATRDALMALPALYGDVEVLQRARSVLPPLPGILAALDELQMLVELAGKAQVTIDLADLRGYQYESGAIFAIYVPKLPNAVARGGRYDHVGEAFGRARPATGFSLDLRELGRLLPMAPRTNSIRAPWARDPSLHQRLAELRAAGEVVIQSLPGHEHETEEFECDRTLVLENGQWIIKSLG